MGIGAVSEAEAKARQINPTAEVGCHEKRNHNSIFHAHANDLTHPADGDVQRRVPHPIGTGHYSDGP